MFHVCHALADDWPPFASHELRSHHRFHPARYDTIHVEQRRDEKLTGAAQLIPRASRRFDRCVRLDRTGAVAPIVPENNHRLYQRASLVGRIPRDNGVRAKRSDGWMASCSAVGIVRLRCASQGRCPPHPHTSLDNARSAKNCLTSKKTRSESEAFRLWRNRIEVASVDALMGMAPPRIGTAVSG